MAVYAVRELYRAVHQGLRVECESCKGMRLV